jgi:hypothetical protein
VRAWSGGAPAEGEAQRRVVMAATAAEVMSPMAP